MVLYKKDIELNFSDDEKFEFLELKEEYKDRDIAISLLKDKFSFLSELKSKKHMSVYKWYEDIKNSSENTVETFMFFDTETSHLNGFIVSIAVIKTDKDFNVLDKFYIEMNPGVEIDPEAIEVHKITNEMVKDLPGFNSFKDKIRESIESSDVIIAQNAIYDIGVIVREFERAGEIFPEINYLDTMNAFKNQVTFTGKKKNPSLEEAATAFGVNIKDVQLHNAMDDTEIMLKTFILAANKEESSLIDNK